MNTVANPPTASEEMKKCFGLLEEGEKIIRTDQKDAVLVVGNTGSGKTTLVQFLAGNDTQLIAEETSPGEFIIADTKNRISTSTIVSQTIFPDLNVDREYNIGFYDCPGYVDTRGAAIDIAGTYFIRKVIDSVERVKIIITVNYTSVRKGIDRGDFLELIRHVLSFIKNVDKYCDSVAMVVTKVDNTYAKNKQTRSKELVSDDTVQQAVAKFLETFRENVRHIADEHFSGRATKLINALLSKNGTSYERIGIFRRPDEVGPLSQNNLLQEGKRVMKKMIVDSIGWARVHPNDFGFSISDRSKNEVKDLIEEINKTIKTYVVEVCAEMEATVDNKHQQVKDVWEFENFLTNVRQKINSFEESVSYETNLKDFVRKLLNLIVDLRVNVSKKSLSEILKQGKYLDFLELVSERKVEGSSLKWKEGFRQITDYLREMKEWYNFLNRFGNQLSSYEIQKFKSKFSYLYESTISSLADEKMKQFLRSQDFHITSSLEEMMLDTTQIMTFNNLIRSALNTSTSIEYDHTLKGHIITGDYILLSEIDDKYFSNGDEVVAVFSSDKIFIDKNITDVGRTNKNLNNFAMIAPTWEVIGTEIIALDGQAGDLIPPYNQHYQLAGTDGKSGSPGRPGNPGINFFGVTRNCVNSQSLMISANGGDGGPGQDGGYGMPGKDGASPLEHYQDGSCGIQPLDWFSYTHTSGLIFRHYCSLGSRGSDGGDGGDGGIGGHGAPPGRVTLVGLDGHKPLSTLSNKRGSEGRVGLGGKKGAGGKAGKSVNTEGVMFWWSSVDCGESERLAREDGACSDDDHYRNGVPGKDGYDGRITSPIQPPKPPKPAENGTVLIKYKQFMRQRLILDELDQHEKYQFLNSLDQNSVLTQTYTVADLVSEFIGLENEYLNLSQDFNWLVPYEQLLKLVEFQMTTSTFAHQQVLSTLQKAIVSKLCLLKVKPHKTLITQVPRYLESEETNLKQFLKEDESLLVLSDNHVKLRKELTKSFLEVQQRAQPMADKTAAMTDIVWKRIKNVVDELVSDTEIKNQEEKQQELQKNLILFKVLQSIRETAQFLNAMSTFGSEIVSVTRLPNKYTIKTNSYESANLKLQEILLQVFPSETNELPEQFTKILENAMNHKETSNEVKNLLKRFAEVAEKSKKLDEKLDEILEMRKVCRDLLRKVTDLRLKDDSLKKMVQIIQVFLHVKDATILTMPSETTTKRAEILTATLHKSTAYDYVHFYDEKLRSVVEQVFHDISSHLEDEIVDTSRNSKHKYFDDIKLLLQQLQKSAKLPEDLCLVFQQLLVDVNIISTTYDSLSYFQEFERLLVMKSDIPMSKIENTELKNMADILEIMTESNMVLGQYCASLKNMQQIVFPFGNLYEKEFGVYSGITNNVKNVTNLVAHKLQTMKSSIEKKGLYVDPDHVKLIFDGEFTNDENGLGAFYVWKNKDHKKTIEDLLAGNEVTLKSDIVNGVPNDAVKFSSIRIKFTCKNELMQSELDEDLHNLQVSMVHGEDSYYRCGNEFYRLTFDRQTLIYSYRMKANGEPSVKNLSYDDIKNGASILSPYTQWSIQLKEGNFEKLARYKDWVDIELVGQGKWIKDDGLLCSSHLQKYYTLDDTISEANAVEDDFIDVSMVQLKTQPKMNSTLPQLRRVARSLGERPSEFGNDIFDPTVVTRPLLENAMLKQINMTNGHQKQVSFCATAQTSLNNCLLLLDMLVRRFTNVKPKYFDQCSTSYLHGKICSVQIVRDFDTLVESLCDYPHQYDVDPIPLMELISKDIASKNGRNIAEILLKSVQSDGSAVPDEFYDKLRSKMAQEYSKSELLQTE